MKRSGTHKLLDVTDGTGFMNGESFFSIGIEGSGEFFIGLSEWVG